VKFIGDPEVKLHAKVYRPEIMARKNKKVKTRNVPLRDSNTRDNIAKRDDYFSKFFICFVCTCYA